MDGFRGSGVDEIGSQGFRRNELERGCDQRRGQLKRDSGTGAVTDNDRTASRGQYRRLRGAMEMVAETQKRTGHGGMEGGDQRSGRSSRKTEITKFWQTGRSGAVEYSGT